MKAELAQKLVAGLKRAGIDLVTYLPETRLSQILPLLRDDPAFTLVPVASESEDDRRGRGVIRQAVTVTELAAFQREMEAALTGAELKFIVCKIEESVSHREIIRTDLDPLENKYQFVRYLERTEGRAIFRGRG